MSKKLKVEAEDLLETLKECNAQGGLYAYLTALDACDSFNHGVNYSLASQEVYSLMQQSLHEKTSLNQEILESERQI